MLFSRCQVLEQSFFRFRRQFVYLRQKYPGTKLLDLTECLADPNSRDARIFGDFFFLRGIVNLLQYLRVHVQRPLHQTSILIAGKSTINKS